MYCIDTNVIIGRMTRTSERLYARFSTELAAGSLSLPSPVLAELWYGAANSANRARNEQRIADFLASPIVVLPFDADDAREAGDIRAHLKRAGTLMGPYDILIAAQARRREAILVTANTSEFARVPRLVIENWI